MLADWPHRRIDDGSVDLRHQYGGGENWQREAVSGRPADGRSARQEIPRVVAHRVGSEVGLKGTRQKAMRSPRDRLGA